MEWRTNNYHLAALAGMAEDLSYMLVDIWSIVTAVDYLFCFIPSIRHLECFVRDYLDAQLFIVPQMLSLRQMECEKSDQRLSSMGKQSDNTAADVSYASGSR